MKLRKRIKLFILVLALVLFTMLPTANVLAADLTLEEEDITINEEQIVGESVYGLMDAENRVAHDLIVNEYVNANVFTDETEKTELGDIMPMTLPEGAAGITFNGNPPNFVLTRVDGWPVYSWTGNGFPSSIRVIDIDGNTLEIVWLTPEMVSGFDRTTPGIQNITISYYELSFSFTIEVVDVILVIPDITMATNATVSDLISAVRSTMRLYDANNPTRLIASSQDASILFGWSSGPGFAYNFTNTTSFTTSSLMGPWESWEPGMLLTPSVWDVYAVSDHTGRSTAFTLTIIGDKPPYEGSDNNNNQDNDNRQASPQTGDISQIAAYGIAALLSLFTLVMTHMKRSKTIA